MEATAGASAFDTFSISPPSLLAVLGQRVLPIHVLKKGSDGIQTHSSHPLVTSAG